MSIELSSTPPSAKPVTGIGSQSPKGKVKSNEEDGASVSGSFSAILTSLDVPIEQSGITDTTLPTQDLTQVVAPPASDSVIPLNLNFPTDLAMLLEHAGKVADPKLSSVGEALPVAAKGINPLTAPVKGGDKVELLSTASDLPGIEKLGDFKKSVEGVFDQMALAMPSQSQKSSAGALHSDAASLAESRASKLSSQIEVSAKESTFSSVLTASGMGESLARAADKTAGKSSTLSSGYGVEGLWGQNTSLAGNRFEAPSPIAEPSMLTAESAVADTVSYWVTQGVQNAQLKLDGFGGEPVEVSISLKGDEAQIDFRTDQPEIRQILEGAVSHLKELLTNEGLVLSGVSVGASGQEGSGAQEQRSRPDARQATIVTTEAVPTVIRQPVDSSVGRALDLFV